MNGVPDRIEENIKYRTFLALRKLITIIVVGGLWLLILHLSCGSVMLTMKVALLMLAL